MIVVPVFAILLAGQVLIGPGFPLAGPGPLGHAGLFEPSDALRFAADAVIDALPREVAGIRTLIRPAMTYDLGGRMALNPQVDARQFAAGGAGRDWGLLDSAVLGIGPGSLAAAEARRPPPAILARWEDVATIPAALSLPTALDLDPFQRPPAQAPTYATFWLLRPRKSSPLP